MYILSNIKGKTLVGHLQLPKGWRGKYKGWWGNSPATWYDKKCPALLIGMQLHLSTETHGPYGSVKKNGC